MVSSSCLLETNFRFMCLRGPLSFYGSKQDKRGLLLVLLISIPFFCLRMPFLISARNHDKQGLLFVLLIIINVCHACARAFHFCLCASRSLHLQSQQTGSSYFPLKNNSCLLCSIFKDRQIWNPNFSPVTRIQSCRCEIIWAGTQ